MTSVQKQPSDSGHEPQEPQPETLTPSWKNLAENKYAMAFCFILGAACFAAFPFVFFNSAVVARKLSIIMVVAFIIMAISGYTNRNKNILRKPPPGWVNKYALGVISVVLSLMISAFFEFHKKSTGGFTLVAMGVFFLLMIVQPVNDYGLLPLFMTQPILSVMAKYPSRFHPLYIPLSLLLLFTLTCQYYFVHPFDQRYQRKKKTPSADSS